MTDARHDLLIELGTEELPPTALRSLRDAFVREMLHGLDQAGLEHGPGRGHASPRHLAVIVEGVADRQPDREIERLGPGEKAAFDDDGRPTKAAEGFARSCGVDVADLTVMETDKGRRLAWRGVDEGQPTEELAAELAGAAIDRLPLPKRMRWGGGDVSFSRPVHWVVLLHGDRVLPGTIMGLTPGRRTRGHRFHHPDWLELPEAGAYVKTLRQGRVIVDFDERREIIRRQVEAEAFAIGGRAVIEDDLLDEVTALVEWPVALCGSFDAGFLRVPEEALVSSMQGHQKYFPVRDADGGLMPRFITVANLESRDPQQVIHGNERVIRPRLADAAFFWDQDRKRHLGDRIDDLRAVSFQKRLGSLHDKSERVAGLAVELSDVFHVERTRAFRAAWLAKTDLMTEMVGEFPELQGIMGRYYAIEDGEPPEVAEALDEVYQPRYARDAIPNSDLGRTLALAERVDTLVGLFGTGKPPSGAKDPFGLRRAALGVLRILIEAAVDVDIPWLLERSRAHHEAQGIELLADTAQQVHDFLLERLRPYYHDRGIPTDTVDAVLARVPASPLEFDQRVQAVHAFRRLDDAAALAAANKRIRNILRKAEDEGTTPDVTGLDTDALVEPAEKALAQAVHSARDAVYPLFRERAFEPGLTRLAELRPAVDRFFDEVMVMSDDERTRHNRIALLAGLESLFLEVADISRLQA